MLDAPELARRLCAAMDQREPKLKSKELAKACGVTKQAVYEWRTTGRIAKAHLFTIAATTGTPLEYWLEPKRGDSKITRTIWKRAAAFAMLAAFIAMPQSSEARVLHNVDCWQHSVAKYLSRIHIVRFWRWLTKPYRELNFS